METFTTVKNQNAVPKFPSTLEEFPKNYTETIVYGGAFNPPTKAHQTIVQECVNYAEVCGADVWLLPSASRADKAIETSRERRIELCRALTRDVITRTVNLDVETMELDRECLTETYDTVQELAALYPERHFTWVFGADSVATMRSWDHGDWLVDHLPMLVIGRPGTEFPELGPHAVPFEVDAGAYSSTELRRRMTAGEDFSDVVGPEVLRVLH